jgi:hypothetical protein
MVTVEESLVPWLKTVVSVAPTCPAPSIPADHALIPPVTETESVVVLVKVFAILVVLPTSLLLR